MAIQSSQVPRPLASWGTWLVTRSTVGQKMVDPLVECGAQKRKELQSQPLRRENLLDAAEEHISSANRSLVTDPSTSKASAIMIISIMRMVVMMICM